MRWMIFALALAACSKGDAIPQQEQAQLLEDRNWMDRWPTDSDQRLYVYRFTPTMGGGVYQDRTLFSGSFELFTYTFKSDELTIDWPDRGTKERIEYRIENVSGPHPFDLKLTLPGTAIGPKTLYGMRNEGASKLKLRGL